MNIVAVKTRWIDEHGLTADVEAKVGRVGEDVRLFALHTLGWVRIQQIVRFHEIEFDPRATRAATVSALIRLVRSFPAFGEPWLVRASAYTGRSWHTATFTDQEPAQLVEWLTAMAEIGAETIVPSGLQVEDLPASLILRDEDPVLRTILARWRDCRGRFDLAGLEHWSKPLPGINMKVLQREPGGSITFAAYHPSATALWAPSTFGRFVHSRVLESVPDRALAQQVVRSAVRTLSSGQPRAERFRGPCLRSDGQVEQLDWLRVSLPFVDMSGRPESLIVFCRRMPQDLQRRVIG